MLHEIKNNFITAIINDLGAELVSLKFNNIDILNDSKNSTWNKVSPFLFPVVSKLYNESYLVNETTYFISKHGFARNMIFDVVLKNESSIIFKLSSSSKTFKYYPFNFELYVSYLLDNNNLKVNIKIKNTDNKDIYFMIGGHPGFKVPFYDNEKYEDYYLEFENHETCTNRLVLNGSISNEYIEYLNNENKIKLQHNLFDNDALILNNLSSKYVDIRSNNHKKYIRFYFNDFETLAIWATNDEQTKFICLEPWSGINIDYQKINDKIGSNKLNINEEKTYSYTIQVKGE
mgnify:CR=1 FL=1